MTIFNMMDYGGEDGGGGVVYVFTLIDTLDGYGTVFTCDVQNGDVITGDQGIVYINGVQRFYQNAGIASSSKQTAYFINGVNCGKSDYNVTVNGQNITIEWREP